MSPRGAAGQAYSSTPLAKKLGIGDASRVLPVDAPPGYRALVAPLPQGVVLATRADATIDLAHVFAVRAADLRRHVESLRKTLRPDAVIWVSWPKKASGVASDLSEDAIRDIALPLGLVDVKVCAVDAVWSGLKLVVRKALRG